MRPLRFLVVEDDEGVSRALVRMLRPHGQALATHSVAEGIQAFDAADDWAGLVLDVRLPDGTGFDVLSRARVKTPTIPALVVTGYSDAVSVNRAFDLGASCVVKPISSDRITRFVRQRVLRSDPPAPRWQSIVDEWAVVYELTSSEIEILQRAVSGASRDEITETRGTAESTVKKHISNLLRKTGDRPWSSPCIASCARAPSASSADGATSSGGRRGGARARRRWGRAPRRASSAGRIA